MGELLRKGTHLAVGFFAMLVARIPAPAGVALAVAALVHNTVLLPRYARVLWRDEDRRRGYSAGVVAYSITLVLLTIVFYGRPEVIAGAWGVLAFGDGASTLAGQALRGPRLPWNEKKTWSGFLAFVLTGGISCALLVADARRCSPSLVEPGAEPGAVPIAFLAGAAALAGAIVESLPLALDDNVSAPLASAAVLAAVSAFDPASWELARSTAAARFLPAFSASVLLAALGHAAGAFRPSGLAAGVILAAVIGTFGGSGPFAALVVFVIAGAAATRLGWARKSALGIEEKSRGRRGARHALAKLLVPAVFSFLSCATTSPGAMRLAAIAALAAAAADTLATEIGALARGKTRLLPSFRPVAPGTPGGVSFAGFLAAILGASAVAAAAWAATATAAPWLQSTPLDLAAAPRSEGAPGVTGLGPMDLGWVVAAAILAGLAESIAGAALVLRGLIGRGTLNLLMTACAAWIATLR